MKRRKQLFVRLSNYKIQNVQLNVEILDSTHTHTHTHLSGNHFPLILISVHCPARIKQLFCYSCWTVGSGCLIGVCVCTVKFLNTKLNIVKHTNRLGELNL